MLNSKLEYNKDQMNKFQRPRSPQPSRILSFEQEYCCSFFPLTEEILLPLRAKERVFKKLFDISEPFEPVSKPYVDNIPIDHLKELLDYFKSLQDTTNFITKSKMVRCDEPSVINWIEKSFEKRDHPGDGPQSLNQKLPKVHFVPPLKMKLTQPTIKNDVPLLNHWNSSSDEEDNVSLDNNSTDMVDDG